MADPTVVPIPFPRSERDVLVHGTAAVVELDNPSPPNGIEYRGWGAVVVGENQHAWVHLPIAIPLDLPGFLPVGEGTPFEDLARLVRLEVHYEVSSIVEVRNLHLWDGGTRFFFWDFPAAHPAGLQVGASQLNWHGSRALGSSLGVSIGVIFPTAIDSHEPPTTFTLFSAQAHLE